MPEKTTDTEKKVTTTAAEKKAAPKKTTAKKTTAKKSSTAKKTTKKTSASKTSTAAKKTTMTMTYTLQFNGNDTTYDQIRSKVIAKSGMDEKDIKKLEIYIKPEEGLAYYVINGTDTGDVELF